MPQIESEGVREPEVLAALPRLREAAWVDAPTAATIERLARGELVSVRAELRLALYLGVTALLAGIGLFVKDNLESIGPLAIAIAGAMIVAGLFVWVFARAQPFTWGTGESRHLAFDFLLLFAALLGAGELAFVEKHFTPLGDHWSLHLLAVSLGYAALAVRFDSKALFSLALSTFAAWRGVSLAIGRLGETLWRPQAAALRWNALGCGVLFVVLGLVLKRSGRKAHFEPAAVGLGWLLIQGALLSGRFTEIGTDSFTGALWAFAASVVGAGLALGAWRARRFGLFAWGVGTGYAGLLSWTLPLFPVGMREMYGCSAVFGGTVAIVVGLVIAHRGRFRGADSEAAP
jgi:hypothetical protein